MLKGKQRSYLKKLAHNQKPLIQMGKEGASDSFTKQLDELLENKELVKVNVLENSGYEANDISKLANEIAERLAAEYVQAIGRKFVLYRESDEEPEIVLPR